MQSLLPEVIHLPSSPTIRDRALIIADSASDQEVLDLAIRLVSVSGFTQWALAAALGELLIRRTASDGPDAAEAFINDFCALHGLKPKLRRELLAVHTFYPPDTRVYDLTYEHYRDAMLIASDGRPKALARATATLARAHDAGWSVSDMRRHARAAAAIETPTPPTQSSAFDDYHAVSAFAAFVHASLPTLASWTPERIALIASELHEAREFLDRLDALARLTSNARKP